MLSVNNIELTGNLSSQTAVHVEAQTKSESDTEYKSIGKSKVNIYEIIIAAVPFIVTLLSVLTYYYIPDTGRQKPVEHPYYIWFSAVVILVYALFLVVSFFNTSVKNALRQKTPLLSGIIGFITFINIVTTKTSVLPVLYFPSPDRIIGLIYEQRVFLLQNLISSLGLLIKGFVFGGVTGFFTGLALGYNKKVAYWLNPITKFIGPIPTTAWIPLALSVFATTDAANTFLLAFAVWFPVTLMTSSGISGTEQTHFEVAGTLGASTLYKVFKVAVPSAMPSIFLGVFYGTVSSFTTLMAVEMNGNSSGIGWYINWQKQVMMYDGVYAGLIIIAIMCSAILTLLFKVRDRILVWQKGVIKW